MGKLNVFEISFANISGVYFAGNVLQGHVTVELTEPMKMKGITLHILGGANVSWLETQTTTNSDNTTSTTTYSYTASEKYFEQYVLLYGSFSGQGSTTTELSLGRHEFPFSFQLPTELPSSFEGGTGEVRYSVRCIIDKPWKFNHVTKRLFTIISVLDLNQQPDSSYAVQGCKEKTICCWCCASGPIQATFYVDRKGYVPGEAIQLHAVISNGSTTRIDKSFVSLLMITTFHATTSTTSSCKEVARITRPGIAGHSEDVWEGEQLIIPPLPPSYLVGCKIIDIKYIVQLHVDPSGLSRMLRVPLEIIIGTIPLASVVQHNPPSPPPSTLEYGNWAGTSASGINNPSSGNELSEIPPPSYYECVTGKVNVRDKGDNEYTRGTLDYAPVYTYYNWGNTHGPLPTEIERK